MQLRKLTFKLLNLIDSFVTLTLYFRTWATSGILGGEALASLRTDGSSYAFIPTFSTAFESGFNPLLPPVPSILTAASHPTWRIA